MGVETLVILLVSAGIMVVIAIAAMVFSVGVDRLTERFRNWWHRKTTNNK